MGIVSPYTIGLTDERRTERWSCVGVTVSTIRCGWRARCHHCNVNTTPMSVITKL